MIVVVAENAEGLKPSEVAHRLRHAMRVLETCDHVVCKEKDHAEAVAEIMRLAEAAADFIDPRPPMYTLITSPFGVWELQA